MPDMTEGLRSPRTWLDHEASLALAGCTRRFQDNQPLLSNLEAIFSYLAQKFCVLCNYSKATHVFVNRSLPETHVISADLHGSPENPKYRRLPLTPNEYRDLTRICCDRKSKDRTIPRVVSVTRNNLETVLKIVGQRDQTTGSDALLLPFDYGTTNMGAFLLWNQRAHANGRREADDEAISGWIGALYGFLQDFFERKYRVLADTYLPSYYAARWGRAAIMFADIRNFTPLTEILRNTYSNQGTQETGILKSILNEHCREMARLVQESQRGRIDKFLGDGLMAVFGEYTLQPSKAVCRAVMSAVRMVERFGELKPQFLQRAFGGSYETEYNESVSIELGIGINYGTVLFDYFGDELHAEYTAVGDHVNFAQRLESEASRADELTGMLRPPILLSATAERCCRPWLNRTTPVLLHPKGKGYSYTVFGLYPPEFKRDLYALSESHDSWDKPWEGYECGPPTPSPES